MDLQRNKCEYKHYVYFTIVKYATPFILTKNAAQPAEDVPCRDKGQARTQHKHGVKVVRLDRLAQTRHVPCLPLSTVNREFSIAVNGTSGRSRDNVCPIDFQ